MQMKKKSEGQDLPKIKSLGCSNVSTILNSNQMHQNQLEFIQQEQLIYLKIVATL
jgi:hypothetical protein